MSNITLLKIRLKNPNIDLLKQAVIDYAKEIDANIVDEIQDYFGTRTKVLIGIMNKTLHRGVGVDVDENGEVTIKGDFYGVYNITQEQIAEKINQRYVATATQIALRNIGYHVTRVSSEEKIILRAIA